MKYPKPIMKTAELIEMGFPEQFLLNAFNEPNQTFATKISPHKKSSGILYDTEGFENWRAKQCRLSNPR